MLKQSTKQTRKETLHRRQILVCRYVRVRVCVRDAQIEIEYLT